MERLPGDLIGKISSYLCDNCWDIISLSLTCRDIYSTIHFNSSHLWYDIYRSLVHQDHLIFKPNTLWKESVIDMYQFLHQESPIHIIHHPPQTLARRSGHSMNTFDQKHVIHFGGATTNFIMTNSYDLFIVYSDHSIQILKSFERFPIHIGSRWLHTGSTIGPTNARKVIIYGGHGLHHTFGDTLLLELWHLEMEGDIEGNIPTVTCSRPIYSQFPPPSARGGHSAIVYDTHKDGSNSSIYIFGGRLQMISDGEEPLASFSNEIWHMDCSDCLTPSRVIKWKPILPTGSYPHPRYCHSAVCYDDSMIVFGGWTIGHFHENIFLNDLHIFNVTNQTWNEVITCGIPPSPRCQTSLLFWNSLVSGGYSPSLNFTPGLQQGYLVVYGGAYHSLEVSLHLFFYINLI
jgi:hypothetical protein